MTLEQKRRAVEPNHPQISVSRQCNLLDLSRSSLYYVPQRDTSYNEQLMILIDEQYLKTPFYGVTKMTEWLRRLGHPVNPKRIRRLMRQMGLEAIYPRRRCGLSVPDQEHTIYPYLLKNVAVIRPDQVWSADITYVRMYHGWSYWVAIMDWFSRYVIAWELSVTLEPAFCVTALEHALHKGQPPPFMCILHPRVADEAAHFPNIACRAIPCKGNDRCRARCLRCVYAVAIRETSRRISPTHTQSPPVTDLMQPQAREVGQVLKER